MMVGMASLSDMMVMDGFTLAPIHMVISMEVNPRAFYLGRSRVMFVQKAPGNRVRGKSPTPSLFYFNKILFIETDLLGAKVVDSLAGEFNIVNGSPIVLASAVLLVDGGTAAGPAEMVVLGGDALVLSSMQTRLLTIELHVSYL